jgi:hypothetical protein
MKITVDWCNHRTNFYGASGVDLLSIEPIPVFKFYPEMATANYRKCPAHQNQFKNTFVVCSPIDMEVVINKEESWCDIIEPPSLPKEAFNPRFKEENESPYPLFTFRLNRIMLMPQDPSIDVYVEQLEPILEWERDTNIRIIEGNFNISKWTRPLEASYEQRTKNMTVKFKRGQPMYYFRLSTNDPEDIVVLNRVEMNKESFEDSERCLQVKEFAPNKRLKFLYDIRDKFIESLK